jgi:dipeptidase D
MAAAMAMLIDENVEHGPLEALFTVDEETGLTGAFELGEGMLTGKYLVNLDSEDEGEIFIGCAGGIDTVATFENTLPASAPDGYAFYRMDVAELLGGHSGDDIEKGRANSIKIMARWLYEESSLDLRLSHIDGGNLRNAIPRAASAVIGVPAAAKEEVRIAMNKYIADVEFEYKGVEPNLVIDLESADAPAQCIDKKTAHNLICALYCAPHGVISMSRELEGLVETSTNLAAIKMLPGNEILVTTSQRSSVDSRKWDIAYQVETVFALAGAKVTHGDGYPGWAPNMQSPIMEIARDAYKELYGITPAIKAIHAGLECGLFLQKYPHLDMVSFGPTLQGVHSPTERMHIPAVERFWGQLTRVLEKVADLKK